MAVTGVEGFVEQRFKQSAQNATTATLVASTSHESESRPKHLAMTEVRLTWTARPENFFGATTDDQEYIVTIRRVG